ncbi:MULTISPECIES: immunity 49 family protein [Myxococcus]|uniref:immunity 49 family protein n=1 Tax=Myxococcus TaxID=32 RepID=UPI0013900DA8|nr:MULTISPECIES: immunity 49 family protein [Myxococcus]NOK02200.1 hypothetical protein [Myxococcus xanthus]
MLKMNFIRENAFFAVEELEKGLKQPLTAIQRETLLTRLSTYLRIAAISTLLVEADTPAFRRCLRQSAAARRDLLVEAQARSDATPGRFACASRTEPLFDALAAGEAGLAQEIARHSPRQWSEKDEFEDDFRYADFLHELLLAGTQGLSAGAERALSAFQQCSADTGSTRLAVCEALASADQDAFDVSLEELLVERAREFKDAGVPSNPERFQTERHIFVEGLALLRLAEGRQLRTHPEYRMLPRLAR